MSGPELPTAAIANLTNYQGQADMDGVMVTVSRQALDEVLTFITALNQREAPQGWQPIEAAPKDGTHILVCRGPYSQHWGFNQRPPQVVHYWPNPGEEGFYLSSGGTNDDDPVQFTHWCLPTPPEKL